MLAQNLNKIQFLKKILLGCGVLLALLICIIFMTEYIKANPIYLARNSFAELTFFCCFGFIAGALTVLPIWLPAVIPNRFHKANIYLLWFAILYLSIVLIYLVFSLLQALKTPNMADCIMLIVIIILMVITFRLIGLFSEKMTENA